MIQLLAGRCSAAEAAGPGRTILLTIRELHPVADGGHRVLEPLCVRLM